MVLILTALDTALQKNCLVPLVLLSLITVDSTNNILAPQPCLLDNSKTNAAMLARSHKKTRNSGKSSRSSATALRRAGEFVCPEIREANAQLSGDRTPICSSSAATKTTSPRMFRRTNRIKESKLIREQNLDMMSIFLSRGPKKKLLRKKKSLIGLKKMPDIMKSLLGITKSNV